MSTRANVVAECIQPPHAVQNASLRLGSSLLMSSLLMYLGRQQMVARMFASLLPTWEIDMKLLASSWPSPGCRDHLGSKLANKESVGPSFSHPAFQVI